MDPVAWAAVEVIMMDIITYKIYRLVRLRESLRVKVREEEEEEEGSLLLE